MATERFTGKVAVVTGAGSGIGRASAARLAAEGALVVVNDLRAEPAAETVRLIVDGGGSAEAVPGDVLEPGFVDRLLDGVAERHGRLDILHNNVGFGGRAAITEVDDATWARGIDGNLGATFRGIRAALRIMGSRGGGTVVNTASMAGTGKVVGTTPYYGTAKAAVIHLTQEAAVEGGPLGIRVNAVVPGSVRTPAFEAYLAGEGRLERYAAQLPLPRVAEPADIAAAVAFLASDDAAAITGIALPVDSGLSAVLYQPALG
ncbi:3-oxoacyl-(acyl-carrier-protein) reductase [Frankia canadensis]|uniref:3-oxoacyl-(Acyl-carrier-protein) reductase n=1 Tax=Frankia canadensis TaxID=1836972 RepID=A0A2I2KU73_9ACTN|nr:glucose 1-dehydrogenase [Frankia canadensis]SNQ49199.1 3-oxoacyl-(acyl-carrier-protein) reductase [Frankia canadensis]SOU56489.1 3-oxoacyl-(acyl-carrier-protein) reductase [Frankia canadensis]